MRKTWIPLAIIGFLVLLNPSCALNKQDDTEQFVITDRSSGRVLNSYNYSKSTGRLVSTSSYNEAGAARRLTEYEYDAEGNLQREITSRNISAEIVKEITDYSLKKEYDNRSRLTKTIQISDAGNIIETFYGYDETGALRGVVQRDQAGNLIMMDY